MDFITSLPQSNGKTIIWVIVDRLSKYGHFCALPEGVTAPKLAEYFVREYVQLHGFPRSIVTDRDPLFISEFWRELFKLQGTELRPSTVSRFYAGMMVQPITALRHSSRYYAEFVIYYYCNYVLLCCQVEPSESTGKNVHPSKSPSSR